MKYDTESTACVEDSTIRKYRSKETTSGNHDTKKTTLNVVECGLPAHVTSDIKMLLTPGNVNVCFENLASTVTYPV